MESEAWGTLQQRLSEILQNTYFSLNPLNPNNTEDNFQELLRENLSLILNMRVDSEISVQKSTRNIFGDTVNLKNKSERYDLAIPSLHVLFELKNLAELDEYCQHQLLNYLDNSDYHYGILVNFAKPNKKHDYRVSYRIYKKENPIEKTDTYGYSFPRYTYSLYSESTSENYIEVMGNYCN